MEILIAIGIAGMVLALSVPASVRFYESVQYRAAVRDVVSLLAAARYAAINSGRPQDVAIDPGKGELRLQQRVETIPDGVRLTVHSAGELRSGDAGIIRFYPEGGASGGGVDLEYPSRRGVRIHVDWLVGSVSQEPYVVN